MTPFLSSTYPLDVCLLVYFSFTFQDLPNSILWGPHYISIMMFLSVEYIYLHVKDDNFKSVNIDDIVFCVKLANVCYITCFALNFKPI